LVEKFVKGKNETFWALKNINLTIRKGEKVGIIGPNGSGKTSLLKIISGITTPTTGTSYVQGKIVSLIDLEAGFHPDLTGEQNIYLNGMLLGMKKYEIAQNLKKIIAYADIGKFIDTPLFTYSSGMKLRLGFSIAIHADPDILILDEGMAVGDKFFFKKTQKKLRELFEAGKTILMVSHWLEFLEKNCQKIYILDKGKIVQEGGAKKIIRIYKKAVP
jgi:lipopolysaccharide transport system ATP-binding protein